MASARTFAQFIYSQNPQTNTVRMTLYNYFRHVCSEQESFGPASLMRFYQHSMSFKHWREHRQELSLETQILLEAFLKRHSLDWQDANIKHPDSWEIFECKQGNEFIDFCEKHYQARLVEGEKLAIKEGIEDSLSIIRWGQHGLRVNQVFPLITLHQGHFFPLDCGFELNYGADLSLLKATSQHMYAGAHLGARFDLQENRLLATLYRGYNFHKVETTQVDSIKRVAPLFYALKKLEGHYLQRQTDPFYQEMTSLLETASDLVSKKHPEAISWAKQALQNAEMALEQAFTGDKLLTLQVKNLHHQLEALEAAKLSAPEREESVSSWALGATLETPQKSEKLTDSPQTAISADFDLTSEIEGDDLCAQEIKPLENPQL